MADNKQTLLEMVQDILSDMTSDNVNSIFDTEEAQQVAQIIKSTYYNMTSNMDRPWLGELFQLESAVSDTPTKMKIPDDISKVEWIKYDVREDTQKDFVTIEYKNPQDFTDLTYKRNSTATDVDVVLVGTLPVLIHNNRRPTYWTSFDDEYIWMDAYDSDIESSLQSAKTVCHGYREAQWTVDDTFIPDLPSHMFPWLLAESKSICAIRIKQANDPTADKQARNGKVRHQYAQHRISGQGHGPNYGRK